MTGTKALPANPESAIQLTVVDIGEEPPQKLRPSPTSRRWRSRPTRSRRPPAKRNRCRRSPATASNARLDPTDPNRLCWPTARQRTAPREPPELLSSPPLETPSPPKPAPAPPSLIAKQVAEPRAAEPQRLPVAELSCANAARTDRPAAEPPAETDELQRLIDMALPLPSAAALADSLDRVEAADEALGETKESPATEAPAVSAMPMSVNGWTLASSTGGAAWEQPPHSPAANR